MKGEIDWSEREAMSKAVETGDREMMLDVIDGDDA